MSGSPHEIFRERKQHNCHPVHVEPYGGSWWGNRQQSRRALENSRPSYTDSRLVVEVLEKQRILGADVLKDVAAKLLAAHEGEGALCAQRIRRERSIEHQQPGGRRFLHNDDSLSSCGVSTVMAALWPRAAAANNVTKSTLPLPLP